MTYWQYNAKTLQDTASEVDLQKTQTQMLLALQGRYLEAAVAHAKAHGVHVDVIRQSRPRSLTVVLRKLLHKRRWSALVFED